MRPVFSLFVHFNSYFLLHVVCLQCASTAKSQSSCALEQTTHKNDQCKVPYEVDSETEEHGTPACIGSEGLVTEHLKIVLS